MKKIIGIFALIMLCFSAFSQTNIFPPNGNVGIGTITPDAPIEIYKSSKNVHTDYLKITMPSWSESKNMNKSIVWDGGGNIITAGIGASYNGYMVNMDFHSFYNYGEKTDSDVVMRIQGNGYVGIGTTSPLTNLHIKGTNGILLTTDDLTQDLKLYRDGDDGVIEGRVNNNLILRTKANHDNEGIIFQNSSSENLFFLNKNGNAALQGKLEAKEIKVLLAPTADFVFEDDYKLKEIEEVELYIKENKHLPDFPSGKEIEKNGVSLGEMDAKLLQKIEELTLYMIEQNKKTNLLIEENQELRKEIEALKKK